jgi:peptidoglycan/LPS O-acetylase OafA/YrhL
MSGGFAGVDVFFVISGYVIAKSLQRQILTTQRLSIAAFYARRFRRLAPNYVLMVVVTLALSHLFFDPYVELPQIKWAAISSFLASTNIYFLLTDRYDALIGNPLRHLWSLGVEEHFYLLLPWLYVFLFRRNRDSGRASVAVRRSAVAIGAVSLTGSLSLVYLADDGLAGVSREALLRFNFFGSPLRFWEILAGVAAAHVSIPMLGPMTIRCVRLLSSAILLLLFFILTDPELFPNLWTVALVAATSALLVFPSVSLRGWGWVTWLSVSLQFLGNISYAWYLWHWPVFVVIHREFGVTIASSFVGIGTSLLIAFCTTRWLEEPFYKRRVSLFRVIPLVAVGFATLAASVWMGRSGSFYGLFPRSEGKEANFASANGCGWSDPGWSRRCIFGSRKTGAPQLLLIGDSNARAASDGLILAARENDWSVVLGVRAGCPALFSTIQVDADCAKLNAERLTLIREIRPDVIIIVNHWLNYRDVDPFQEPRGWTQALRDSVTTVHSLRIPLVIQHQIPVCRSTNSLIRSLLANRGWESAYQCTSTESEDRYIQEVIDYVDRQCSSGSTVPCHTVDITESLCTHREECRSFVKGINFFSDSSHVSPSGSQVASSQYAVTIRAILKSE